MRPGSLVSSGLARCAAGALVVSALIGCGQAFSTTTGGSGGHGGSAATGTTSSGTTTATTSGTGTGGTSTSSGPATGGGGAASTSATTSSSSTTTTTSSSSSSSGSCSSNLMTDPNNCGKCGYGCGGNGASCIGGACQLVASSNDLPFGDGACLAIDANTIYFTTAVGNNNGAVGSIPKGGGNTQVLAPGQNLPLGIAVDASGLYWVNAAGGEVMVLPAGGSGTPQPLVTGEASPEYVALDATSVYWTTLGSGGTTMTGAVRSSPKIAPLAQDLAAGRNDPRDIAVDGTDVYWSEQPANAVYRISKTPLATTMPTTVAANQTGARGIALDSAHVYWVSDGDGAAGAGAISFLHKASVGPNGVPAVIVSGLSTPWKIAIDATDVYWTEQRSSGDIGSAPEAQGATETVVVPNVSFGTCIAADANSVYWTAHGVWKAAK